MPKDTFLNLPEDKRTLIEDVAIEEFLNYGYDNASINRIVAAASIAKGSFYQYFENKEDLFLHLFTVLANAKMEFLSPIMLHPEDYSFIQYLEELYRQGIQFTVSYPKAAKLNNLYSKYRDHSIMKELMGKNQEAANEFFENLLQLAIERGEIRADIDKKLITFLLTQLNYAISEYFLKENTIEKSNESNYLDLVDKLLDLIKNGIIEK